MANGYGEYICPVCGAVATEWHHIVFRSECIALIKCSMNLVKLCTQCHNELHHGKYGYKINRRLKLEFQNKIEFLFCKNELTKKEIKETLSITEKEVDRLLKMLIPKEDKYIREDAIRACMGGKIILEEMQ